MNYTMLKLNIPEKKLSVKVGHINVVHVNHMNEAKSRQGLKNNSTVKTHPGKTVSIATHQYIY